MRKEKREKDLLWIGLVVAILLVIAIWGYNFYIFNSVEYKTVAGYSARGTFGDMFGGVNALFSGLAFACLIYTVFLQSRELRYQRDELELTRNVMIDQAQQVRLQNEVLKSQTYENTFFQLLALHNNIVNSIDLVSPTTKATSKTTRGRDCFSIFYRDLVKLLQKNISLGRNDIDSIDLVYKRFYDSRQTDLGHYFRSLYNLVKFVHTSNVKDKHIYTNLIRAQLSNQELCILFYNCLSSYGSEKFKPLVENYSLLKNLTFDLLVDKGHCRFYEASAFGATNPSNDYQNYLKSI